MKSLKVSWLVDNVRQQKQFCLPLRQDVFIGRSQRCDIAVDFWRWQDVELTIRNANRDQRSIEVTSNSISSYSEKGKKSLFGSGQSRSLQIDEEPIQLDVNDQKVWLELDEFENRNELDVFQLEALDQKINEVHSLVSNQRMDTDDENEKLILRNREISNAFKKRLGDHAANESDAGFDENSNAIKNNFNSLELRWLVASYLKRLLFEDIFGSSNVFRKPGDMLDKLVLDLQSKYVKQWLRECSVKNSFEFKATLIKNSDLSLRFKTVGLLGDSVKAVHDAPKRFQVELRFNQSQVQILVSNPHTGKSKSYKKSIQDYILFVYQQLDSGLENALLKVSESELIRVASSELQARIEDLQKFGPLTRFFDPKLQHVTDVSVDRLGKIFISVQGSFFPISETVFRHSLEKSVDGIKKITSSKLDRNTPVLNSEVCGLRANIVHSEIGSSHQITLRKKFLMNFSLSKLEEFKGFPPNVGKFLRAMMKAGKNSIISGGLGSGKTSMLIAMLDAMDRNKKIATIEDTREIEPAPEQHFTPYLTRAGYDEQKLLEAILRSAADLIALGEIRSPRAADAMVKSLNTGQAGITTIHSNSAKDTVTRLVNLLSVASQADPHSSAQSLNSALDFVIHMHRNESGVRRIQEVCEVVGVDKHTGKLNLKPIFETENGILLPTGMLPKCILELQEQGYRIEDISDF